MDFNGMAACPECGAAGCRDKFGEMLALEFESPTVFGAVHHITVICFNIQHPGAFTEEALVWMRSSLRAIIVDGFSPEELRKQARKTSKGNIMVRRRTAPPQEPRKIHWSMTVSDIRMESHDAYEKDVIAWARSMLNDLDIR